MRRRLRALALTIAILSPTVAQAEPRPTLIAGFAGTLAGDLADLPPRLTRIMAAVVEGLGRPVLMQSSRDDVLAIAGCAAADLPCLAGATELLEVDHIVLGEVESSASGTAVHLTLVSVGGASRQRDVTLREATTTEMDDEFTRQATAFMRDEPAPTDLSPTAAAAGVETARMATVTAPAGADARTSFSLRRVKPWAWTVGGGGIALLGASALLGLAASGVQDDIDSAPTRTVADLDHLAELEATGRSYARWSNISLLAGGAAAIVGAVFIVKQATTEESGPIVSVAPAMLDGGVGLSIFIGAMP